MKLGKRKRAPLVKCGGGNLGWPTSSPSYEKSFCLCIAGTYDSDNPGKWYTLNLSSKEDDDKEEKEKNAAWLLHIPSAELRGSHLAFHHNKRHQGEKSPVLPLITELKFKDKYGYGSRLGTRCAIVGSKIFRIGGTYAFRLCKPWSRKVTYFDFSHPKEGWKSGPRTNCGRADAAVVALDGKLYVFGGCHPDIPGGFFAEFLDTTTSAEEKGEVKGGWHHLQPEPPQSLGFEELFAAALDDGGEYSGKILVGSKLTGVVSLYDAEQKLWKTLDLKVEYGEFISNPIVADTTIYWFKLGSKKLCAYDFVQRQMISICVGDFKICQNLGWFKDRSIMCPTLLHLAGNLFCMLWVDDKLLHCTKLRVLTTEVIDASVLCCHSYRFDQAFSLADCLPVQPSQLNSHSSTVSKATGAKWFLYLLCLASCFFFQAINSDYPTANLSTSWITIEEDFFHFDDGSRFSPVLINIGNASLPAVGCGFYSKLRKPRFCLFCHLYDTRYQWFCLQ